MHLQQTQQVVPKMRNWAWSLLAFLSLIGGCLAQVQCGRDAGGALCPDGLCCSQYGYCGTTAAYCTDGCQSQCTPVDTPQCGRGAGGALCPDGLCCSQYGFCGNTPDYCGDGCQSQCTPVDTPECGKDAGGALCPDGLCCSQYGFCGNTPDYCGDGCQSQCTPVDTPECGRDAGGALCPDGLCCSQYGFCGNTPDYCGDGCQSQCTGGTPTPTPSGDLTSLIPQSLFNEMLKHRSNPSCQGGFYTYNAFIAAARSFAGFASVGDTNMRKREIAAFLAQTSHETTGGWASAPDGPYAWGYCFIQERGDNPGEYCSPNPTWPCAPNKKYFGRGPIQISWNYNYGPAGRAIGSDLLSNPDLVASDPTISFKTAFWFWMTTQSPKPSCHDVIVGRWTPSDADRAAGRLPGFGLTTNIINGGLECGHGPDDRVIDRIGFYWRYCDMLGVSPGDNLDCYNQRSYNLGNSHFQDELVKQS